MTKKLKVGIIGCGGIAFEKHMPGLAKLDAVELIAFCNRSRSKAERAAAEFGEKESFIYQDYSELLKNPAVDVVHICTPNDTHAEISIAAMKAAKDVMVEKPMAVNAEEAEKMYEKAQKTGRKLSVSYQYRFNSENLYLKKLIEEDKLGEIYFAKSLALRRRGVPTWGTFLDKKVQGGGPLIDIGTHALDLTLWLMDNYQPKIVLGNVFNKFRDQNSEANYFGTWDPEKFTVEDSAFAHIIMENGASIILESSWALNIPEKQTVKTQLSGPRAGADNFDGVNLNGEEAGKLFNKKIKTDSFKNESAGDMEMRLWIEALREDKKPAVTAGQALVVSQILEAIYISSESGEAYKF